MRLFVVPLVALALLAGAAPAVAEYPDRPIHIVAPFAPGGNIDVSARIVADKLREVLGVTVIVDNKPGASGMIGGDAVARAAPDGYTLLVSSNALVAVPLIYGNAPFDWHTAFQPISRIHSVPAVLVVAKDSPIRSLAEFIRIGREQPGKITVGDPGVGTTNHICLELLSNATGAKYTSVHYKGSGAGFSDVMAGQVQAQVDLLNSVIGYVKGGSLRALAVSSDKRMTELPDVPTMKESGVAGLGDFTFAAYTGLYAPAGLPPAVVARLHDAMMKVLTDPAVVKRFTDLAAEAQPSTPAELAAQLDAEDRTITSLIKRLGLKAE
jgi:tripartite-type tricarboxylate transporter receptor subunit TctC